MIGTNETTFRQGLACTAMLMAGAALATAAWAAGQAGLPGGVSQMHPSLCADCHYASQGMPNPVHLEEWASSAHGRAGVGCESCHGGNPNTVESFAAHQGIIRDSGLESPLHPRNLPAKCGGCHSGPFVEFQKSRHYLLLRNGYRDAPTCSTCHGTVAAHLLSPKGLESQCNACHGRGKKSERVEYAANARILMQNVHAVRELLEDARPLVKRVKDNVVRSSLQYDLQQAEVPLTEAVHDAHAFVFTDAQERLGISRERANALLDRLANLSTVR